MHACMHTMLHLANTIRGFILPDPCHAPYDVVLLLSPSSSLIQEQFVEGTVVLYLGGFLGIDHAVRLAWPIGRARGDADRTPRRRRHGLPSRAVG